VIDGAGPGQGPGPGDHPEGEVVVRDVQLHGPAEERRDGGLELPAGQELEARAVGPVVNEDAHELLNDRFRVLHQFGEPAVDLFEGWQRELGPDPGPGLIADRLRDHRCLVADAFQQPLGGERVPAQGKGPQGRVGAETDLDPPVFDAHQVSAAHGRGTPGVPPGVSPEPVLGVGIRVDQPDPAVVADGEGFACPIGPDLKIVVSCGGFDGGGHGGAFFRGAVVRVNVGLGGFDEGEFVPVGGVAGG
jgi:hypothetical protein